MTEEQAAVLLIFLERIASGIEAVAIGIDEVAAASTVYTAATYPDRVIPGMEGK